MAFVSLLGGSPEILGAEVVYVDPKLRFAIIDQGNMHGITADANVCVLSAEGVIISCGGVVIAKKTKAGIKMPPSELDKIKVGMKVQLKAIYLKQEPAPDAPPGAPATFAPAKTPPGLVPGTVRAAAAAKEEEISKADGSAARAKETTGGAKEDAAAQAEQGKEVPHDAKDPYDDLDKLDNALGVGEKARKTREQRLAEEAAKAPPPFRSLSIEPMHLIPLASAVKYNNLSYATTPRDGTPNATLWEGKPETKAPKGGTGFAVQIVTRTDKVYTGGWRYLNFLKSEAETGLDESFPELAATSITKTDSTGVWLERGWRFKSSRYSSHDVSLGADLTMSELTFHSDFASSSSATAESSGVIASARSKLSILSFRFSTMQHATYGRFVLTFGLAGYVPLKVMRDTHTSDVSAPAGARFQGDAKADLKAALGHEKSGFGAEAWLGAGMQL